MKLHDLLLATMAVSGMGFIVLSALKIVAIFDKEPEEVAKRLHKYWLESLCGLSVSSALLTVLFLLNGGTP